MNESDEARNKRLIQAYFKSGDISTLTPDEKQALYLAQCRRMRLDPMTRPFDVITLNKKEVLYTRSTATDAIAVLFGVTRKTTIQPCVKVILGSNVFHCEVLVSLPDGRSESSNAFIPATVPLMGPKGLLPISAEDICNLLMKVETKARRRGTLAITGAGMMDASEFDTIKGFMLDSSGDPKQPDASNALRITTEQCLASPEIAAKSEQGRMEFNAILSDYVRDSGMGRKEAMESLITSVKATKE